MTKVSGASAYQQLRVPENYVGQALGNLAQFEAQKSAAKKLAEEREQVRISDRANKWFEENAIDPKNYVVTETGNIGYDKDKIAFSQSVLDQNLKLRKEGYKYAQMGDIAKANEITAKIKANELQFENYLKLYSGLDEVVSANTKMMSEGKMSGAYTLSQSAIENGVLNGMFKTIAADGKTAVAVVYEDENGNKVQDVLEYKDLVDMMPKEKLDLTTVGTTLSKDLKTKELTKRYANNRKYDATQQVISWDDVVGDAEQRVDLFLKDEHNLLDVLNQLNGRTKSKLVGKEDFEEGEIKQAKNFLLGLMKSYYNEKEGTPDFKEEGVKQRWTEIGMSRERLDLAKTEAIRKAAEISSKGTNINKVSDLEEKGQPVTTLPNSVNGVYSVNIGGKPIKGVLGNKDIDFVEVNGNNLSAYAQFTTEEIKDGVKKVTTDYRKTNLSPLQQQTLVENLGFKTVKEFINSLSGGTKQETVVGKGGAARFNKK